MSVLISPKNLQISIVTIAVSVFLVLCHIIFILAEADRLKLSSCDIFSLFRSFEKRNFQFHLNDKQKTELSLLSSIGIVQYRMRSRNLFRTVSISEKITERAERKCLIFMSGLYTQQNSHKKAFILFQHCADFKCNTLDCYFTVIRFRNSECNEIVFSYL